MGKKQKLRRKACPDHMKGHENKGDMFNGLEMMHFGQGRVWSDELTQREDPSLLPNPIEYAARQCGYYQFVGRTYS